MSKEKVAPKSPQATGDTPMPPYEYQKSNPGSFTVIYDKDSNSKKYGPIKIPQLQNLKIAL
jgi:hypothetical protein